MARFFSKAMNFSPCKSFARNVFFFASGFVRWQTNTIGSSCQGMMFSERCGVGKERIPISASSLMTLSTTSLRMQKGQTDLRLRIARIELLRVEPHVLQPTE